LNADRHEGGRVTDQTPDEEKVEALKDAFLVSVAETLRLRRASTELLRATKGHRWEAEVQELMTPEERQEFGLERWMSSRATSWRKGE
jgi:hypothetical protein